MPGQKTDDHDEYEYEYHDYEREVCSLLPHADKTKPLQVFYVDLDLSSLNGVIRPKHHPRKHLRPARANSKTATPTKHSPTPQVDPPTPVQDSTNAGDDPSTPTVRDADTPSATPATATDSLSLIPSRRREIQILELHSHNPVISYENEVYSCSWSDMIGTSMFFSKHQEEPHTAPLRSTEDYDLLGTSRVKLIGRKATVLNKTRPRGSKRTSVAGEKLSESLQDEEPEKMDGSSLGSLHFRNPSRNKDLKRQAAFLETLMNVKRAKGQTDNVRTVFNPRAASLQQESKGQNGTPRGFQSDSSEKEIGEPNTPGVHQPDSSAKEIEDLNRKVVKGDADALKLLQQIYARQAEAATGGTADPGDEAPDTPQQT